MATAARVLQWIAPPQPALDQLCAAVEPGGWVVVLDYNHAEHSWDPPARPEFRRFFKAFLQWREANGWSKTIADELPAMFCAAGLVDVESRDETETDVQRVSRIWSQMTKSLGPALVAAGYLTEGETAAAFEANEAWRNGEGRAIRFVLKSVAGRVA